MRTKSILTASALSMALITVSVSVVADQRGEDVRLREVRTSIEENNLAWTAGETSMSGLGEDELRERLIPLEEYRAMVEKARAELPGDGPGIRNPSEGGTVLPPPEDDIFDWRDEGGEDWTSPVRDQGQCGSCTIFAGVASIEGAINVALGDPAADFDLSEQFLLGCTSVGCESGGMGPNAALAYVKNRGVPDEACQPYLAQDGECGVGACADYEDRSIKISEWDWASGDTWSAPTVQQIKEALSHGPVGTSMTVFGDLSFYTEGVYEVAPNASELGGHSVAIVGWNDANDSWYVKNSWGTGWGQDGFFEIRRGQCGIGEITTSWVDADESALIGAFSLDSYEHSEAFEWEAVQAADFQTVLARTSGDEEMTIEVRMPEDASWLTADVNQVTLGQTDETVDFHVDLSGWTPDMGEVLTAEVVFVGPPGLARVLSVQADVTYNVADAGSEDSSGDDSCGCNAPGSAGGAGLLSLLSSMI